MGEERGERRDGRGKKEERRKERGRGKLEIGDWRGYRGGLSGQWENVGEKRREWGERSEGRGEIGDQS